MPDTLYTIGHSNHPIDRLVALLRQHEITAVCDVRSKPYSRYNPHFDREALKSALEAASITYVFLGKELGARSDDPSCYLYGKVQYTKLAQTALFQSGLQRVRDGMKTYTIALMCAEKEPLDCHRTILVSRQLAASGLSIQHIHEDGRLEPHADALVRLAQSLKLRESQLNFFRSSEDLFADAYALQEKRIGYDSAAQASTLEGAAG
jgi:uncharacterized protein (DUF488 family)